MKYVYWIIGIIIIAAVGYLLLGNGSSVPSNNQSAARTEAILEP